MCIVPYLVLLKIECMVNSDGNLWFYKGRSFESLFQVVCRCSIAVEITEVTVAVMVVCRPDMCDL